MSEKLLLTVNEASTALGVGRSFLYAAVQRGELDSIKLGRARRIPRQALDAFIERLRVEQANEVG